MYTLRSKCVSNRSSESPDVYAGVIRGDFPEQSIYLISIPMKIGIHINLDSGLRRNNNIKDSFLIEEWAWRKPIGLTGRESIGLFK